MKHLTPFKLSISMFIAIGASANTIPDTSPIAPAGAPKSSFVSDHFEPTFGRDPFFPKTDRFKVKVVEPEAPDTPKGPVIPANISLKGISSVEGRRLAILNNYTLSEGEEFTVKTEKGEPVKVKCVSIKEKSVVVQVGEHSKEIALRAALQ